MSSSHRSGRTATVRQNKPPEGMFTAFLTGVAVLKQESVETSDKACTSVGEGLETRTDEKQARWKTRRPLVDDDIRGFASFEVVSGRKG